MKKFITLCLAAISFTAHAQITFLGDLNPGANSSSPSSLTKLGLSLFFAADDGTHGSELWKSNGTPAGTVLLKELVPGSDGSFPYNFTVFNGSLYFAAFNNTDAVLWKTDGTAAGTVAIKTFTNVPRLFDFNLINGSLIFFLDNTGNGGGFELWKTDGTTGGTVSVKTDFTYVSNGDDYKPLRSVILNNELYFSASDAASGVEIWKTNGSLAGTSLIKDINPFSDSNPAWLLVFNNAVYFSADDGANGTELWKTNGTTVGTSLIKNVNTSPGTGSDPQELTASTSLVYFSANDGVVGSELWASDGTTGGTSLVKNINTTITAGVDESSNPTSLVWTGTTLLFAATTTDEGTELWRSDGTGATTILLNDINPGSASSNPDNLFLYSDGSIYFSADDGTFGTELWSTTGLTETTYIVYDINTSTSGSYPHNFCQVNPLFFAASTDDTGEELYMLGSFEPVPVTLIDFTVQKQDNKALLKWQTAQEENSSGFEIQKSVNGIVFTSIGFIASPANNTHGRSYAFIDENPGNGKNFYRLRQIDLDGKAKLSETKLISFNINSIKVFPNPVTNILNILATAPGQLTVSDAGGRVMVQKTISYQLALDVTNWPAGLYFVQLRQENGDRQTFKITKQ
jgi:ELWxxDGT repeat protein